MSVRISWAPSLEPDIASYDLEWTDALGGPPWVFVVNIPHIIPGPNFDDATGKFFFDHLEGDVTKWYRLFAIDLAGNRSVASTPFQATPSGPAIPNAVKVDHNFPTPANLRYQTGGGSPIEGAIVRIFKKSDFDQGLTAGAVAVTLTNARGEWTNPVFLNVGFSYTITFQKEGLYGPDNKEITV